MPPVRRAISCKHGLAAVAKAGGFDGEHVQHAAQFVQDKSGEGFAVDIFSDDDEFALADLDEFLEQGNDVLSSGDLLLIDQRRTRRDHGFHLVGVGDEVRGEITAVELHAFDEFLFRTAWSWILQR